MAEKNKLSSTDSEELELGSPEGVENVSEPIEETDLSEKGAEEIEYFQRLTGREFKNREEFEKHYKELVSFVGQNPQELKEKAEAFDKMIEEANKIVDEAELTGELEPLEISPEIIELRNKVEEMELLNVYPEAKKVLNSVYAIASGEDISLKEAYEKHLKNLVLTQLAQEEAKEKEQSISVESKARLSSTKAQQISQLIERAIKEGTDEAKEALVREYLAKE